MQIPRRDTEFTIYQEAIERNPDTLVMAYASSPPPHLSNDDGHHDITKPDFHREYAEWLYANLVITEQRYGVQVEMIDLLNEPDLQGKVSRSDAAEIFASTVPALRQLVEANFDQYGIEMPLITGTSNLTANGGANWLSDFAENDPASFAEIDVLTTHPYGPNGFNQQSYDTIAGLKDADHPLFIQNEMEFGHSSFVNNGRLPDDALDDDLEGALSLARATAIALEAGADGFHVFQGVNPNSAGAKSLVHTPWGQTAVRRKGFYVYDQMTDLQPRYSDVVADATTGAPEGFHTYAFNQWGDNRVFVNVVNATAGAESTTLTFRDNAGRLIPFSRVASHVTDATRNLIQDEDLAFGTPIDSWTTSVDPHSVHTYVVELTQTGYSVPVGDVTYLRERGGASFSATPQDGDVSPRPEILVGLNGTGAAGTNRGVMRGLFEFDLGAAGLPQGEAVESARVELRGYRGTVGESESIRFDLYELPGDFVEGAATWIDPDGDGSPDTGDRNPGGTLGLLLGTSPGFSGSQSDFNANGDDEIFHQRVVVGDTTELATAVANARDTEIRFALDPNQSTTDAEFFGFFDEDTEYAPELIVVTSRSDISGPTVAEAAFNYQTDERVVLTFDEPIDTASLTASDLMVTNRTTGEVVETDFLTLASVTPTSAELIIRSRVFGDADWRVAIPDGAFTDEAGNGNAGDFSFEFFRLRGDANRDRVVDLADYTVYRDTFGGTEDLRANFDNGGFSAGVIDAADRAVWMVNFGAALSEPVSSGVAAPAPAAQESAAGEAVAATDVTVASPPASLPFAPTPKTRPVRPAHPPAALAEVSRRAWDLALLAASAVVAGEYAEPAEPAEVSNAALEAGAEAEAFADLALGRLLG